MAEIRTTAAALALPEKGEGFRRGFGAKALTRYTLVKTLLGDEGVAHWVLSAVSHGEQWALLHFGFNLGSATAGVATMEPPVTMMSLAVLTAMRALARASWADSTYRGWDIDEVVAALEESYDAAGLADEVRFWRDK